MVAYFVFEKGLTNGSWKDANRYENFEFKDTLTIDVYGKFVDFDIHYTTNGAIPTPADPIYTEAIKMDKTGQISFQAFKNEKPLGHTLEKKYFYPL